MTKKSSQSFTRESAIKLMQAMEDAISNMIEEIRKPVDAEVTGSARKAELSSIKQTAIDCKELIAERHKLEAMISSIDAGDGVPEEQDFGVGFAEKHAKKK